MAATAPPATDAAYELVDGVALGEGDGALHPGSVVTVLDVVDRGTPGVGRSAGSQVLALHRFYALPTRTADGGYVYLEHARVLAIDLNTFTECFAATTRDPAPVKPPEA